MDFFSISGFLQSGLWWIATGVSLLWIFRRIEDAAAVRLLAPVLILLVLFMPEGIVGTVERGERTVLGRLIGRLRHGNPAQAGAIEPPPVRTVGSIGDE